MKAGPRRTKTLKLSGAVVGAALVVIGGHYFAPSASTFPLTVYVHGKAGPQDTVLQNSGMLVLECSFAERVMRVTRDRAPHIPPEIIRSGQTSDRFP